MGAEGELRVTGRGIGIHVAMAADASCKYRGGAPTQFRVRGLSLRHSQHHGIVRCIAPSVSQSRESQGALAAARRTDHEHVEVPFRARQTGRMQDVSTPRTQQFRNRKGPEGVLLYQWFVDERSRKVRLCLASRDVEAQN